MFWSTKTWVVSGAVVTSGVEALVESLPAVVSPPPVVSAGLSSPFQDTKLIALMQTTRSKAKSFFIIETPFCRLSADALGLRRRKHN